MLECYKLYYRYLNEYFDILCYQSLSITQTFKQEEIVSFFLIIVSTPLCDLGSR